MIHHFQPCKPESPERANWKLRLIVACSVGATIALPARWLFDADFLPVFWMCALLVLSVCMNSDIEQKYAPIYSIGNWMEQKCNTWRIIRRGIIIYRDDRRGPCLFLPWESLHEASIHKNCIQLTNDEFITVCNLPVGSEASQSLLSLIQSRIKQHATDRKPTATYENGVWFTGSPRDLPTLPYVIAALPWFISGALCPFLFPDSMLTCLLFFIFGASCATCGYHELEETFYCEDYVGREARRTGRGIVLRTDGDTTHFIPWAAIEEGYTTTHGALFLRMRGEQAGLMLTHDSGFMPIPTTQSYGVHHRRIRMFGRFAFILAAIAAGILWYTMWK